MLRLFIENSRSNMFLIYKYLWCWFFEIKEEEEEKRSDGVMGT